MDFINRLEKEINDLRKTLHEKENELYQIKKEWMLRQQQPMQGLNNVSEQYTQLHKGVNSYSRVQIGERLSKWAIERYSRQILLPDIGVSGQEKLCAARVLIVGAGGLGCPAAIYLAGAGVGEIGIVDYDSVDITNIHRQILHSERDQYMNKAESAAQSLRSINSYIKVTPYNIQLDSSNALELASRYDVVLDCTDNVPTRYMLNDLCAISKLPLISGSALKMEGQLTVYGFRSDVSSNGKDAGYIGPCYRCVFPKPPPAEAVGSCSANGVAGPVPGVIGCLQALEAIKYIVGRGRDQLLVERMLLFDGEDITFRTVRLRGRNLECAVCSDSPTILQLLDYETFCKAQAKEKKKQESHLKSEKRKMEKEKRMSGQSYYGFRATAVGEKRRWVQDVPKEERKMGPRCKSEFCAKGTSRKCNEISDKERAEIFRYFWNDLDWRGKKGYARSLIESVPAKRRRSRHKGEVSRKGDSKQYHLFWMKERLPVCRVMFLNTLGVKEAMVRSWLTTEDKPKAKKVPLKSLNVDAYIDSLPRSQPKCHICANGPVQIEYITLPNIKNIYQLYTAYVRDMGLRSQVPASRKTFSKVVAARNLRIFKEKAEGEVCDLVPGHNRPTDVSLSILPEENRTTPEELATELKTSNHQRHLLVDVRNEQEFQMCRIDGSVNYPIDKLHSSLDELLEKTRQADKVTFICRRGNDSQIAAKKVLDSIEKEHRGKVKDLTEGLHGWSKDVDNNFPVY